MRLLLKEVNVESIQAVRSNVPKIDLKAEVIMNDYDELVQLLNQSDGFKQLDTILNSRVDVSLLGQAIQILLHYPEDDEVYEALQKYLSNLKLETHINRAWILKELNGNGDLYL